MKNRKFMLAVIALVLTIHTQLLAEGVSEFEVTSETFPDTSTWILSRIGGSKAKQHTGNKVFITVSTKEKKVSGYTSCNYIKAIVALKDTSLSFSEVSFGKRVCDESTTELEKVLLEYFHQTTSWKIEENILHLYNKGILILEFKNASAK